MTEPDRLVDVPAQPSQGHDVVVISARVKPELRNRVLDAMEDPEKLSDTVRRLLELGLERAGDPDLEPLEAPARHHAHDPETSRSAARATSALGWPARAGVKRRLLIAIEHLGGHGMTSDEAMLEVGYSGRQRLSDLKLGGWLEPARGTDGAIRTRTTRLGSPAEVYVLTPTARRRLRDEHAA